MFCILDKNFIFKKIGNIPKSLQNQLINGIKAIVEPCIQASLYLLLLAKNI